jgi:hypothetical protein
MLGMMRSQASGWEDFNGPGHNGSSFSAAGPAGGTMAMQGGGLNPMGSIQNINQETVTGPSTNMHRQNAGGMGFNNPVGGMLGSVFRMF